MTAYAVLVVAALALMALRGFTTPAGAVGVGILLFGAALDVAYMRRRKAERLRAHRTTLDRIVRAQLVAIALSGVALAAVLGATGAAPLEDSSRLVKALIIGFTASISVIYASALVDWFWILPNVSGVLGPAPCEAPGQERWAGVTNIWLFHRAVATFTVMGVLAGVPAYMAGTSHGTQTVIWAFVGLALTVAYSKLNEGVLTSFSHALNATLEVGDTVRVREDFEDPDLVTPMWSICQSRGSSTSRCRTAAHTSRASCRRASCSRGARSAKSAESRPRTRLATIPTTARQ
jgi:hypothetical protein